MNKQQDVSLEHLQRVHTALRIPTPLHQVSPTMLATLTTIAHCWRDRIPANLWDDLDRVNGGPQRPGLPARKSTAPSTDLKRRAAGDVD